MRATKRTAGVAALALLLAGCGKPAQIGSDPEVHKTVDALFTAVTARDAKQLDRCDRSLVELHAAGRLPKSAHESLSKVIATAREGRWEPAAERLYDFIKGQEIPPDRAPEPPKSKSGKKR